MPVQTINPFIEPQNNEVPKIESIIETEKEILDDIASQFSWNAIPGVTIEDEIPANPIKTAVSSLNANSFSPETNMQGLARTSIAYSEQKIRIATLEGEAAAEKTGYEKSRGEEQSRVNRGGWSLVKTFAQTNKIYEPRAFEGDFHRISEPGINIYHPENVQVDDDGKNYLLQETKDIKKIAQKYNLETRLIDEHEPLYVLLNPANHPQAGVYSDNKILINYIRNLSDLGVRSTVSHELIHAFFGLTPILEHDEGLTMLLSFIRHPEAVNPNVFPSAGLLPYVAEKFKDMPLSVEDCLSQLSKIDGVIDTKDFEYVYGYNFAMSFFDYFKDQGSEVAFDRYMQFYGALKRGIIFSSSRPDPDNPNRGDPLVQGHEKLPGVKDSEVTTEALLFVGIDPDEFKKSLRNTMGDPNALSKQKEIANKLQPTLSQ